MGGRVSAPRKGHNGEIPGVGNHSDQALLWTFLRNSKKYYDWDQLQKWAQNGHLSI